MEGQAKKRRTWTSMKEKEDRLSSLPNDIIIGILSRLPLKTAVVTGVLSKRWPGLWTHVTSIRVDYDCKVLSNPNFRPAFDRIIKHKIVSPSIHRFSLDLDLASSRQSTVESWFRKICQRNVQEIELRCRRIPALIVPGFIFQTTSLVSMELGGYIGLFDDGKTVINLPNLIKLSVLLNLYNCKWLQSLITACNSLEELSLGFDSGVVEWPNEQPVKCSSSSLRRIFMNLMFSSSIAVLQIVAPKLEYVDVRGPEPETLALDHPEIIRYRSLSMSKIYKAISKVRNLNLTLNFGAIADMSPCDMFCCVTHLTLDLKFDCDFETVLRFLGHCLCRKLDVLVLKFRHVKLYKEKWMIQPKREVIYSLGRVKKIEIHTYCCCCACYKTRMFFPYFSGVVKHLFMNALVLEHFKFRVAHDMLEDGCVRDVGSHAFESEESLLCDLLKECYPNVSMWCEVQFVGRYLTMSRKAGSKVCRLNGDVISNSV